MPVPEWLKDYEFVSRTLYMCIYIYICFFVEYKSSVKKNSLRCFINGLKTPFDLVFTAS